MIFKFLVTLLILALGNAKVSPETTAESASARIYRDYIETLYRAIGEAQVNNIYNMVKVFSVSTVEQAHQVADYVEEHCNLTKSESRNLRLRSNATVEIGECIFKREMETLKAYRQTGYNVHNCIRSAQMNYDKSYTDLNVKLDQLKVKTIAAYRNHTNELKNCLDSYCYTTILVQSIIQYESLREELNTEKAEANNLTSRYLVTTIAMGCVSSCLQQIHYNFNVGKDFMGRCFHAEKVSQPNSAQQNVNNRYTTNQSDYDRYQRRN